MNIFQRILFENQYDGVVRLAQIQGAELGMSHTVLAEALEMSVAGVGFSVDRGESISKEGNYSLA
jgi:hypothetical protein